MSHFDTKSFKFISHFDTKSSEFISHFDTKSSEFISHFDTFQGKKFLLLNLPYYLINKLEAYMQWFIANDVNFI